MVIFLYMRLNRFFGRKKREERIRICKKRNDSPKFFISWERRQKPSIGDDSQVLDALLCRIGSWTVALAFLEDFQALVALPGFLTF